MGVVTITDLYDDEKIRKIYNDFKKENANLAKFFLKAIILPCSVFKSEKWYNENIQVLFIAESPPPWIINKKNLINLEIELKNDKDYVYFYNKSCQNNSRCLANVIFSKLEINDSNWESMESKLKQFCKNRFFLTDTIKCIIKTENEKISHSMISKLGKYSAKKILMEEIDRIKPEYIVVIGKTALEAIKAIVEKSDHLNNAFKGLKDDLEKIEKFKYFSGNEQKKLFEKKCIIMPFPNSRANKHNKCLIDNAFKKLKEIDQKN